jgi:hypothetical protein
VIVLCLVVAMLLGAWGASQGQVGTTTKPDPAAALTDNIDENYVD